MRNFQELLVVAAAAVLAACGDTPSGLEGSCPGSGGVVFEVAGALETGSGPLAAGSALTGCVRVAASAAVPGAVSRETSDVQGFELRAGAERWSGTGVTLGRRPPENLRGGGLRVEASPDGRSVRLSAGNSPASRPSGHRLLLHTVPGETGTRVRVQEGAWPFDLLAEGRVEMVR